MDLGSLSTTDVALGAAALVALVAYAVLLVAPAWASYGRLWERVAAGFLTLYMLAALVIVGALLGFAVVWSYDRWG